LYFLETLAFKANSPLIFPYFQLGVVGLIWRNL